MTTKLVLQGFFISYDQYDRAKIMFLDNYNANEEGNATTSRNNKFISDSFTKSYVTKKSAPKNGKHPMTDDNTCFYVKCGKKPIGIIDNKLVPIRELKQHTVELQVEVKTYNFTKMGNKIHGWNINLLKMRLLEY